MQPINKTLPPRIFKFSLLCFWFVFILSPFKGQESSVSVTLNIPKCTDFNSKKGREQELIVKQAMDREAQAIEDRRKTIRFKFLSISVK